MEGRSLTTQAMKKPSTTTTWNSICFALALIYKRPYSACLPSALMSNPMRRKILQEREYEAGEGGLRRCRLLLFFFLCCLDVTCYILATMCQFSQVCCSLIMQEWVIVTLTWVTPAALFPVIVWGCLVKACLHGVVANKRLPSWGNCYKCSTFTISSDFTHTLNQVIHITWANYHSAWRVLFIGW